LRRGRAGSPTRASRIGCAAPDIVGTDLGGEPIRLALSDGLLERRGLVFVTSSCRTCRQIWRSARPIASLVLVTSDAATESQRDLARLAPEGVQLVMSSAAWFDYAIPGAPWMVVVQSGSIVEDAPLRLWSGVAEALRVSGH
jgi:hypothetical protein